jgi:hypothetical protein
MVTRKVSVFSTPAHRNGPSFLTEKMEMKSLGPSSVCLAVLCIFEDPHKVHLIHLPDLHLLIHTIYIIVQDVQHGERQRRLHCVWLSNIFPIPYFFEDLARFRGELKRPT